nr:hypothetical protein [Mycoplasmopsis cynos]
MQSLNVSVATGIILFDFLAKNENKKINTEILNSDLVKFMKIKELKFPSINRVLNRFEIMYEKEIKLLINKIYWIYTKNNIDRDEIKKSVTIISLRDNDSKRISKI